MSKPAAPVLEIEVVPIDRVQPYERNPRRAGAIAKVAASIREFGWRQPIVVDEHLVVIAGHTRLGAARLLDLPSVPIHIARGLTAEQIKAYRIADNRSAEDAEWHSEFLAGEMLDLQSAGFDMGILGFEADELQDILGLDALAGGSSEEEAKQTLAQRFGAPPFDVLDARHGYWQARKRAWIAIGIRSELGRGSDVDSAEGGEQDEAATSGSAP
jgi:hypothetical protein